MDELDVFGTLIDACGAEHPVSWAALTCTLLKGHDEDFHVFERYDAVGDVVESYAWRVES